MRAQLALQGGDLARAVADFTSATESYDRCGYRRRASGMRTSLGFSLMRAGRWEQAREVLVQAIADASELGLGHGVANARQNLGLVLMHLGDAASGAAMERLAVTALESEGDLRMCGNARAYLSVILRAAGDLVGAEAEGRRALEQLQGFPPARVLARAALADALLAQDRARDALEISRTAMGELLSLRQVEEGEMHLRLVHAQALRAVGDQVGAKATIRAARSRLLKQAATLANGEFEATFLRGVPEHAAILDAGVGWAA